MKSNLFTIPILALVLSACASPISDQPSLPITEIGELSSTALPTMETTTAIPSAVVLPTGTLLPSPASNPGDRPRGIFVLAGLGGPQGGTEQSLQIIDRVSNLDYVEGVTVGFSWADTEISPGRYDFSKVDGVIAALQPSGKRLNIEAQLHKE